MIHPKKTVAKKIFKYSLIAVAIVVGIHLILQILNLIVFNGSNVAITELSNRFDLDDEQSLPTWFSSILLATTSIAAFLAAWFATKHRSRRVLLTTIATIAGIFSIDEVATFHEYVLVLLHSQVFGNTESTLLQNGWILVAPFILAIGIALVWWIFRALPRRTFVLLATAGFVFLLGSMAVEIITNALSFGAFMSEGVLVAMEEAGELVGVTIALYGLIDYIESNHSAGFKQAFKNLIASRNKQ